MEKDFFWPIYQQLETELKELSLYIHIDKKQLNTYSIKIADLTLRAVSECENISKELCKKNSLKFIDKSKKPRRFVLFHEYIEKLNEKYNLEKKVVTFNYNGIHYNFDTGRMPFSKKEIKVGGKTKSTWLWHHAYNLIKHDRVKNYRKANLANLIDALAALFLLNVYYKNEKFYEEQSHDASKIIEGIRSLSDVFYIKHTVEPPVSEESLPVGFDKSLHRYLKIEKIFSTYTIALDREVKTPLNQAKDLMDLMQYSMSASSEKTSIHIDNTTKVKLYAYIHEKQS